MAELPVNELKGVVDSKEEIGSGAYGVVKLVSVHGTVCAAKDVHKILLQNVSKRESTAIKEKFMKECGHCSKLLHPNIVQFLGVYYPSEDAELPWLIMERLDCSLTDYVEKHKHNEIYFLVKVSIFHDILLGLQYLHAQNIIHRDLSSNNILLTKYLVAKIADLGMAKLVDPSVIMSQSKQPGTPIFMPPEALNDHSRYNSSIDVFSFGCVMIHLMTQELPTPEATVRLDKSVGRYVVFSQIECREKYLAKIYEPPELKRLILQSIEDLPEKRPSIIKLIEYFEIFVDQETAKGVCLDKDQMISKLQEHFIAQEDTISKLESNARRNEENANNTTAALEQEKELLIQSNERMSMEVARLMSVDVELQNSKKEIEKYQLELCKAEEELQTKFCMLQTYKEDFQQECKDCENAHRIKEEEIEKVRVEKEELIANHHEQISVYAQKIEQLTAVNDKLKQENARVSKLTTENYKLNQENARLLAALEKQKKEVQTKADLYKNKTEQFQAQWRKREEAEKILKDELSTKNSQLDAVQQTKQQLMLEINDLKSKNDHLFTEYSRVDQELAKAIEAIKHAEDELVTKEFMLNTYKEDFEAERKERENAHNIKEDEITKARIEKETFEAECQEKVHNIKQALDAQMNTLKEQVNQHAKENDKLKEECGRLRAELDKEKKDAQGKSDVYKQKTEQFQLQWRKREEAEARANTLTEQLNAQCELNKQLNSTIDSLMRKAKGIDPQIPSNNMASQQSQQRRVSPHYPPFSNMSTPVDTSPEQYHTSTTMSKPRPPYDPSTNPGMIFQHQPPPSSSSQQQAWQMRQEQQYVYRMQQQHQQDQLYLRGQGRGPPHNQPVKPLHEGIHYPPDYQGQGKKFLPPSNFDNYRPRVLQPEYNVAGTNATPIQGQFPHDDYNYGRNSGPISLESSMTKSRSGAGYTNHPPPDHFPLTTAKRPEKPTQCASEGINEEIRYQADKQRRHQEYEEFNSTLQLDPYLICPKCKLQFREGQLPEYRHHIDNCNQ